jgi:hypothetical protein
VINLSRDSRLKPILWLAVTVRVLVVAYLFFNPTGIFCIGDSLDYHKLGISILHHHTFSIEPLFPDSVPAYVVRRADVISYDTPLAPDCYRTPGYPAFLSIIYALGGTPFTAVVVQSILSLLLVWLVVLMTYRLLGEKAAIVAGWIAAVEPLSLIYSHQIMSDMLFVLFFLASILMFMDFVMAGKSSRWVLSTALGGLLMGLAVLTRPVGAYVLLLLATLAMVPLFSKKAASEDKDLLGHNEKPTVNSLKSMAPRFACFMLAMVLMVSVWVTRNYLVFDHLFLSTSADHNLLITITSQIVTKLRSPEGNIPRWQIRDDLEKELIEKMATEGKKIDSPPEKAAYFRNWSLGVIRSHPGLSAAYLVKSVAFLFVSDITGLYQWLGLTTEAKGGWGTLFRAGMVPALTEYFGPRWQLWLAASSPLVLFDVALYALVLIGAVRLWKDRRFHLLIFFTLILGYWIAVSAIGAMPRYRLPMMPFLICLAAGGAVSLFGGLSQHEHRERCPMPWKELP